MSNARTFAKVIFAIQQAGLLHSPACKPAIKTLIRQATEDKHWHFSAHYRSKKAASLIRENGTGIKSPAQYQSFCRRHLRHEHMVPGSVVYELIRAAKPSVQAYERILRKTGYRATITREEDLQLKRDSVPPEFYEPGSGHYFDHLIRYRAQNLHLQLEIRPKSGWL